MLLQNTSFFEIPHSPTFTHMKVHYKKWKKEFLHKKKWEKLNSFHEFDAKILLNRYTIY